MLGWLRLGTNAFVLPNNLARASLLEVCRAASRAGRSEDSSPEMCSLRSFIRTSRVGRNSADEGLTSPAARVCAYRAFSSKITKVRY